MKNQSDAATCICGCKSNNARVNQTKSPKLNYLFSFFHQSCVCRRNGRLNDDIDAIWPQAKEAKDATNFFLIFSCLFCHFAEFRMSFLCRRRRRTCDKCTQFRTFIIYYLSSAISFSLAKNVKEKHERNLETDTNKRNRNWLIIEDFMSNKRHVYNTRWTCN